MEPFPKPESVEERQQRFAEGKMSEAEIRAHWDKHEKPLFEHTLVRKNAEGKEESTTFKVRALTEEFAEPLFESLSKTWAFEGDFDSLKDTVAAFHSQRSIPHPIVLNPEYYIATDTDDAPYAMTGIYTVDLEGHGFALRDQLDPKKHYINAGLGWFAVAPEKQGNGVGGFLHDWIVKMAAARGAKHMVIETDDSPGEQTALALYEKRGYQRGFNVKSYYGLDRDRHTYYAYFPQAEGQETPTLDAEEKLTAEHAAAVKKIAENLYSPDRLKEFNACLDLFFAQREGEEVIEAPDGFILKNEDGSVAGFAILSPDLYANAVNNYWYGSEPGNDAARTRLMELVKTYAASLDREVVITAREGRDAQLLDEGYTVPHGGIPYVYGKGDKTNFLMFTKDLQSSSDK